MTHSLIVDSKGRLNHLLTIEQIPLNIFQTLLKTATSFLNRDNTLKYDPILNNKFIINAFFEDSTRTRCSFEMAAKRLGAHILNFNVAQSAASKGEELLDTIHNLEAMGVDAFVIRHRVEGIQESIAKQLKTKAKIINAGDGCHAHPSQALLDVLSIQQHKGSFEQLTVAIVGDILHSRVARSQIAALKALNTGEIRIIAPPSLLPHDLTGVQVYHELQQGLADVDVIITLRIQRERIQDTLQPDNEAFHSTFGVNDKKLALAKPDVIVLHPGPMNREVEITSRVAESAHSIILQQVTYGVAMRMAILAHMLKE